jgi:hypothetical protein
MSKRHSLSATEPQAIPQAFLDSHYCQEHVMAAMAWDEATFWRSYIQGRVPRGVSLMPLCGVALLVWPKRILDAWHAAGRPAEPGAMELFNEVMHSLVDAFRDAGVKFDDDISRSN